MSRRSSPDDPESLRAELEDLLGNFRQVLESGGLRDKVRSLVPAYHKLRDLGSSLLPKADASGARDRILFYLRRYPLTVIQGDELMVVAGIQEWARRVRELRVQFGWKIATGVTVREMLEGEPNPGGPDLASMSRDDYILLETVQDRDSAHRWHVANDIRKGSGSVRNKLLQYFRANVGKPVSNEELRYVADDKTEWARRVRELRTEQGWPVSTKSTGRPDLPVGTYILEADRQSPEHDRRIPDPVRREVLRRDDYECSKCGWSHDLWNPSDPRHLEIHHVEQHAKGGPNTPENLVTVCTICHDVIHSGED
jgi:hypothetical protein